MKTFSVRIDETEDDELTALAKKMSSDKSAVARQALRLGIQAIKKKEALEKIRKREWTIWKAAEYCNESYRSFLETLREENIPFPLSKKELERELNEFSHQ